MVTTAISLIVAVGGIAVILLKFGAAIMDFIGSAIKLNRTRKDK